MKDNPSEKLFTEITNLGIAYIENALRDKTTENYYLDFKTTEKQDYTNQRKLYVSDKKNYAKCISAFGNTDGGIILWGIKTGTSESDYATAKQPIQNVSNFTSLLEGSTSLLTSPPHSRISHKIIFEDPATDTGYVVTHIQKSNLRPFQVIHENDFRYYIRAGSTSQAASHTFLKSMFGQAPQPDVFITFGVSPAQMDFDGSVTIQAGVILHNAGENVGKNINGYVLIGGLDLAIEINANTMNDFSYSKNNMSGMKIGFVAKSHFILGIEQDIQPVILHVKLSKPAPEHGIQIIILVSCDNQMSYRLNRNVSKEKLEEIYDNYAKDPAYDIGTSLLSPET